MSLATAKRLRTLPLRSDGFAQGTTTGVEHRRGGDAETQNPTDSVRNQIAGTNAEELSVHDFSDSRRYFTPRDVRIDGVPPPTVSRQIDAGQVASSSRTRAGLHTDEAIERAKPGDAR